MTAPYASTRYPGAALLLALVDLLALAPLLVLPKIHIHAAFIYACLWIFCAWISDSVHWAARAASWSLAKAMDAAVRIADRWQGRRT